jgi:hypothetical protein
MNRLEVWLAGSQTALYLGNVACAVVLSSAATLLAAVVCRHRSTPLRYGLLFLGLMLVLTSPGLVWLAGRAGIGWLRFPASAEQGSIAQQYVIPAGDQGATDLYQDLPVRETQAMLDHVDIDPDTPVERPASRPAGLARVREEVAGEPPAHTRANAY